MCKLVREFIKSRNSSNGFGFFAGDKVAVKFAEKVSLSQRRKFKRRGIIPAALLNYLEKIEAIKRDKFIPEEERTVDWLLDLLWETPKRNQVNPSMGEIIRVEILKDLMPWLSNKMGTMEHVWRKGELYNSKQKVMDVKPNPSFATQKTY